MHILVYLNFLSRDSHFLCKASSSRSLLPVVSRSEFHKARAYARSLSIRDFTWLWWLSEMLRYISRYKVYSSLFAAFSFERERNRINEMHSFIVLWHCFSYLIQTPLKPFNFLSMTFISDDIYSSDFSSAFILSFFFFYVFLIFLSFLLVYFCSCSCFLSPLSSFFPSDPMSPPPLPLRNIFLLLPLFLSLFSFHSYPTLLHTLPSNFLSFFLHSGISKNGKTLGKWKRKMCWKQEKERKKVWNMLLKSIKVKRDT